MVKKKTKEKYPKGHSKLIFGWAFYDWANSVYPLIISSTVFPIFYATLFKIEGITSINFLGIEFKYSALITSVTALAFFFVAILSPFLSGIADYTGKKKSFMRLFCYLGSISCMALYLFDLDHLHSSLGFYLLALIGFWGSLVFYNSYLPDIAFKNQQDNASAKGFALGYIGSIILLIFNLSMIMFPSFYGFVGNEQQITVKAMRVSFITVGIWWMLFSQISFHILPKGVGKERQAGVFPFFKGLKELKSVWKLLKKSPIKGFLIAFFVYSISVQTVMLVATYFGEQEVSWSSTEEKTAGLIISILLIQLIAILGAFFSAKASKRIGNIYTLIILNSIWAFICVYAFFIETPTQFYIAALIVGLVMGGIQSLSRSTYSKLLPKTDDSTSFFSFYDITEKVGIIIGLGIYSIVDQITGNMRYSVIFLSIFFVGGIMLLSKIKKLL